MMRSKKLQCDFINLGIVLKGYDDHIDDRWFRKWKKMTAKISKIEPIRKKLIVYRQADNFKLCYFDF